MSNIRLISFFTILLFCSNSWSQEKQLIIDIYYNKGCYLVDYSLSNNKIKIDSIKSVLDQLNRNKNTSLKNITIHSFSSPLGGKTINKKLTMERMRFLRNYIIDSCGIDKSYIKGEGKGVDWKNLKASIENSKILHKKDIINVFRNTPEETREKGKLVNSRNHRLMSLHKGIPYRYMEKNYFHKLRRTTITIVHNQSSLSKDDALIKHLNKKIKDNDAPKDNLDIDRNITLIETNKKKDKNDHTISSIKTGQFSEQATPLLALKTNLLYDMALTPNIGVEIPVNNNWSICTELIYANWLNKNNTFCWQILEGSIEGRYWLNSTKRSKVLSGWFIGAFTSKGFYDFQLKNNSGHQGRYCLLTGLSSGYSMYINQNLGIEFSGGMGYIVTNYRKYKIVNNELIKDGRTMQFRAIIPAKIKCSIIWYINKTNK